MCGRDAFCPQPKKDKKTSKCEKKKERGSIRVAWEYHATHKIYTWFLKLSVIVLKNLWFGKWPKIGFGSLLNKVIGTMEILSYPITLYIYIHVYEICIKLSISRLPSRFILYWCQYNTKDMFKGGSIPILFWVM